jgi:pSer/pThr/pTyr-binding forkhead associated (FHA) protein
LDVGVPDFEFVLTGSRVLIGRAEAADVRLEDPCVSRYHCEIGPINGTLWVRDLGSTHGVFVNGFREMQAYLMPGDRLTIGDTVFRVEFERHAPKSYEQSLT